jgi:hypothetical protein
MRNSRTYVIAALAGSALIAAGPAFAGPLITRTQALSTAGSVAGGTVGGPVGGFLGGFLGRQISKAFENKPPELKDVTTPVQLGPVHPVQADKPLQVKTVDVSSHVIDTPPPAQLQPAQNAAAAPEAVTIQATPGGGAQPASDLIPGRRPPPGTLNAQLAALQGDARAPRPE